MRLPHSRFQLLLILLVCGLISGSVVNGQIPARSASPPSRYIVRLNDNAVSLIGSVEAAAVGIAALYGAEIRSSYSATIKGFSADMTPESAEALRHDSRILTVVADIPIVPAATQSNATWGLDRLDQRNLPVKGNYNYDKTGAGVNIYVVDSGIRYTHSEFGGRAVFAFDSIADGQNGNDCYGHGTHVAGTAGGATYGVAKGASLHSVRVLDCAGSGPVSGLLDAIEWITLNRLDPAVVNISITANMVLSIIDDAVNASVAAGVTYTIAAANHGADACNYSPGRAASAITVGATTSADTRSGYSNWGPCVDVFAPGHGITSAGIAGDAVTAVRSGTSMAAPHAAGVAALLLENEESLSPEAVTATLLDAASAGLVHDEGTGSPDLLLYSMLWDETAEPIRHVSPSGGYVVVGGTQQIQWQNVGDYNSTVTIELSTDGGTTYGTKIADNVANNGGFLWQVPNVSAAEARIRIVEHGRTSPAASSSESFTITLAPTPAGVKLVGRALSAQGIAVTNAMVDLTSADGELMTTRTNAFGYFQFDPVPAGETFIVHLTHKRYHFNPRTLRTDNELTIINVVAEP